MTEFESKFIPFDRYLNPSVSDVLTEKARRAYERNFREEIKAIYDLPEDLRESWRQGWRDAP